MGYVKCGVPILYWDQVSWVGSSTQGHLMVVKGTIEETG